MINNVFGLVLALLFAYNAFFVLVHLVLFLIESLFLFYYFVFNDLKIFMLTLKYCHADLTNS